MSASVIVWLNGEFLPLEKARISPEDRGFLFGDGVYESLRWYPARDEQRAGLFHLAEHIERLRRSLDGIRLVGVDCDVLSGALEELVRRNDLLDEDATVYLQVTRGEAPRKHAFPEGIVPTVYAIARAFSPPVERWRSGVATTLVDDDRWRRCDLKTIGLLPNVLARDLAEQRGAFEAVLVRDGVITEGSHTSVAFVRDGVYCIHPEGEAVLPSVTRGVVRELCAELGVEHREVRLRVEELGEVDEMMLLGSSTEVMPVVAVDGRRIGNGKPGPVTRRLQQAYRKLLS